MSKKIRLAASVDLDYVASKTDGFSGADLQALLYNAHLDAIHASIAGVTLESKTSEIDQSSPVRYTIIGASGSRKGKGKEGDTGKTVMSRAEEMALERRVSGYFIRFWILVSSSHRSCVKLCTIRPHNVVLYHLKAKPRTIRNQLRNHTQR